MKSHKHCWLGHVVGHTVVQVKFSIIFWWWNNQSRFSHTKVPREDSSKIHVFSTLTIWNTVRSICRITCINSKIGPLSNSCSWNQKKRNKPKKTNTTTLVMKYQICKKQQVKTGVIWQTWAFPPCNSYSCLPLNSHNIVTKQQNSCHFPLLWDLICMHFCIFSRLQCCHPVWL